MSGPLAILRIDRTSQPQSWVNLTKNCRFSFVDLAKMAVIACFLAFLETFCLSLKRPHIYDVLLWFLKIYLKQLNQMFYLYSYYYFFFLKEYYFFSPPQPYRHRCFDEANVPNIFNQTNCGLLNEFFVLSDNLS